MRDAEALVVQRFVLAEQLVLLGVFGAPKPVWAFQLSADSSGNAFVTSPGCLSLRPQASVVCQFPLPAGRRSIAESGRCAAIEVGLQALGDSASPKLACNAQLGVGIP